VPGRLASAVRSWDDEVAKYKGREKYGRMLLEYLDEEHRKQVEAGLPLEKDEDVRTYPY
jgi:alpha-1,2-mannosyltransferase